ncbi:hypothetical protein H0H93_013542 [Arthromyces matolae]|nr:hypothetical protein H0H93_013542 [Arthromyces matolae]
MYKHACAVLSAAEAWSWPAPSCMDINESFNKGSEFKTVCRRLLLCLIIESQSLGGSLLESFWTEFEKSHSQFPENVNELRNTAYSSFEDTLQILYDNVDPKTVEFSSIFALATELFTHIGLPFMNEDDRVWRALTPLSTFSPSTPGQTRYEQRRENLKVMVLKRDGTSCPFSEIPYYGMGGVAPIMAYVIPSSIRSKPETLKYLSIIAGHNATDSILQSGDTIDNALAVEGSIAASYRRNCWALEACESPDNVNHATYYFKAFEPGNLHRAGSVLLRDGDEITFGQGPTGTQNRNGPHPLLCNLRLAVSRALYTSGAAEFIGQLMQDADDMDCRHVALQKNFHRALSAKLLISGRSLKALWFLTVSAGVYGRQIPLRLPKIPQWDLNIPPNENSTDSFLFDTVNSLLQHWPNTRYRNEIPAVPEWLATDPEHSYLFCRGQESEGGWHHTYVATRPLKVLYFDGSSAAKMQGGSMDTQDIVAWGEIRPEWTFKELDRIIDLCAWGKNFGLDGFVREIMYCDFKDGLHPVSKLKLVSRRRPRPPKGPEDPPNMIEDDGRRESAVLAAGSWHNHYPGDPRIHLDLTRLFSFYDVELVPSLVTSRFNKTRFAHRLEDISSQDVKSAMEAIETSLRKPEETSGIDWKGLLHFRNYV